MRSRLLRLCAACALLLAPAAAATPSRSLAVAFGNTIKATYADGRFQRYWLQPDGGWHAIGRRGKASSGRWTQRGDDLCLKQTRPFPSPMKYCTPFPAGAKVGAAWSAKDAGGGKITLSLVKGAG